MAYHSLGTLVLGVCSVRLLDPSTNVVIASRVVPCSSIVFQAGNPCPGDITGMTATHLLVNPRAVLMGQCLAVSSLYFATYELF